jgi:MFS family permease
MLKACPHCDAPLRPGEAFLGWCGECGKNLFRKPERKRTLARIDPPPGPPPVPEEWRWVARGILLKLIALVLGVAGVIAALVSAEWDLWAAHYQPEPWSAGILGAAFLIDVVGRLMCLGTPQASARWLVVVSIACQLGSIVFGVGQMMMSSPSTDKALVVLLSMAAGQIGAAVSFTAYMLLVGQYFRSPPVVFMAQLLFGAMRGALGVVGGLAGAFFLVMAFALLGLAISCFCPVAGCTMMAWAGMVGEKIPWLFYVAGGSTLVAVELAYLGALLALLRELWRRKLIPRPPGRG